MKTTERRAAAIENIKNNHNATVEEYNGLTIVSGGLTVAIFGKAAKPKCYFRFEEISLKDDFVKSQKKKQDRELQEEKERAAQYKKEAEKFVKGAILISSWGWEQTNIDFYKILSRKGQTVVLQQIGENKTYNETLNDRGTCVADESKTIGEPFKKRISKYARIKLTEYSSCRLWDGKPKYWSSYA